MTIVSDTTTGTITLTSGETGFTTSGTNMLTRGHRPGDTILRNGFVLVIDDITGQNAGILRDPCPAGAAGTGPTRIRFQPDGSRMQAAARALIELLGTGAIEQLAAITGNNKFGYRDASGTWVGGDITAAARALLGDSTVPRSGTGGSQHRTNSQNDNRFMQPGAFGLGGFAPLTIEPNALNTITATQWTSVSEADMATVGGPAGFRASIVLTEALNANWRYQIIKEFQTPFRISMRSADFSGAWTAWRPLPIQGTGADQHRTNSQNDAHYLIAGTGGAQGRTNTQNDARYLIAGTGGAQGRTNSQNDGRFMQPGALGWGGFAPLLSGSGALNALAASRLDTVTSGDMTSVGGPSGFGTSIVVTYAHNPSWRSQEVIELQSPYRRATRTSPNDGVWTSWRVNGSGSNSNGLFERSGLLLQVCAHQLNLTFDNSSRLSATWTYPAAFGSAPRIFAMADDNSSMSSSSTAWAAPNYRNRTMTSVNITTRSPTSAFVSGDQMAVNLIAIGQPA